MELIVKKRDTIFAKLKWEHEAAKVIHTRNPHVAELTERLDRLADTRAAFEDAQMEIELNTEELLAVSTIFNHRLEFERVYYEVKTIYATLLDKANPAPASDDTVVNLPGDFKDAIKSLVETQERFLKAQAAVSTNLGELAVQQRQPQVGSSMQPPAQGAPGNNREPNENIRLPAFSIPVFRGDRKEWRSFKDLFETGIHNRTNISNALKLQYLLTYVEGEAKSLVSAFPITDANYEPAWTKLKEHYDKKKYIVYSLIRQFVEQSSVSNPATGALHKLVSTSDEVVRQLKALGAEYESRDPWLIHLLLDKVDKDTRSLWAQKVIAIENPTFDEFLKFLQDRCDALETFSAFAAKSSGVEKKDVKKEPSKAAPKEKQIQAFQVSTNICSKCNQRDHSIYNCEAFKGMDLAARREFVQQARLCFNCLKGSHAARNCSSSMVCKTSDCKQRHHTLLCPAGQSQHSTGTPATKEPAGTGTAKESSTNQVVTCTGRMAGVDEEHSVYQVTMLPTALVQIRGGNGELHDARVLIDSGSQVSLVSQDFSCKLGIPRKNARLVISGLSQQVAGTTKGVVHLFIASRFNDAVVLSTEAYILGRLTAPLPSFRLQDVPLRYLHNLPLADPFFNESGQVDVILGADVFMSILRDGQVVDDHGRTVGQNSIFGWLMAGKVGTEVGDTQSAMSLCADIDIDRTLRMFWESEDLRTAKPFTLEEQRVVEHFESTHRRDTDGRFVVRLPFNPKQLEIGESLTAAVRRLRAMERRFSNNPEFKERYLAFMEEYAKLGHMERIPQSEIDVGCNCYYLPHHAVLKEDSLTTKLRVVFDGSCPSSTGISLNQALHVGPNKNQDLLVVLQRFRTYPVVFVADMAKMYRQVRVDHSDTDYQRIVWRANANDPIEHYRLLTVTYGTACAAYLAIEAVLHTAKQYEAVYPDAAERVAQDRYVDDLMTGAGTLEQARKLKRETIEILESAGFHLRKWATNEPALLEGEEVGGDVIPLHLDGEGSTIKALGVHWSPTEDVFLFKVSLPEEAGTTKRQLLSESSRLFDPNGWLAPAIIKAKICYQQTWLYDLRFDDPLPPAVLKEWLELRNNLYLLEQVRIPRWVPNHGGRIHLLGFSDASEAAYAAVIYARSSDEAGKVYIQLVAAKTKLAPVKQVTLPRLELNAAVLLTDLMQKVALSLQHLQVEYHAWTDSTIVLQWLSALPRRWKTYVANRTSAIQDFLPRSCWKYVSTKENPADCASRGISPAELVEHNLWWSGPPFIQEDPASWNSATLEGEVDEDTLEERNKPVVALHAAIDAPDTTFVIEADILKACSQLNKATRVLAYVNRAVNYLDSSRSGFLTVPEINKANLSFIRLAQHDAFDDEIQRLRRGEDVFQKSKLKNLYPFLDGYGVLRVGGRLQNSDVPYDMKHPIILPKQHRYTQLLIEKVHLENLHCGPSLLISSLNQRFWILGCSSIVRQAVKNCVRCCRLKGRTAQQLMGNLPSVRTTQSRAFAHVGVDYAGPVLVKSSNLRGSRTQKGYIAVFVCLCTKAVHLEAASDLSTDSFLNALKRFVARRGLCNEIWSDNGTNFVGADNQVREVTQDNEGSKELKELYQLIQSSKHNEAVTRFLANKGIKWQFITPLSPHKGGIWEAAVKSTKKHLRAVVGKEPLTFEELATVLTQTEACLNSRPLCAMSTSPDSLEALTPGHFLIGQPLNLIPEPGVEHIPANRLNKYQQMQRFTNDFWRRWRDEYLSTLQTRIKWTKQQPNLEVGQLVAVKNDHLPPSQWELARITAVHPGQDGIVRIVTLRRGATELQRSVTKICPLLDN